MAVAAGLLSSNRTFMELKYRRKEEAEADNVGSNRTFMELKSTKQCIGKGARKVLIVPLWN